jgi:hypothetical protein
MPEPVVRTAAPVHERDDVAALVIESTPELGATLLRYTAAGAAAGDIWYGSAEEAQLCAARDFGAALGPWREVPPDEPNPVAFVLRPDR